MKHTVNTWKLRNGVEIKETRFCGDLAFEVGVDDVFVTSIPSGSTEQSDEMRDALDRGEDVRDWEDGHGNSVGTLIEKTRTMEHEEEE